MIDPRWAKTGITDFSGSWTTIDPTDVPLGRALVAQNVDYMLGQVRTRFGYATAYAANEAAVALFPWVSSLGPYLVWFKPGTGVRAIKLDANPPSVATIGAIATAGVTGASFANAGPRLYVTAFNSSGAAVGPGYVITYKSGSFNCDQLFAPPMIYVPAAPTEPGSGYITAGLHRIGYVVEHRSGYIGRPSPDSGVGTPSTTTFTPVNFTSAGSKNLSLVLNPTAWPTTAAKVHIVMSPASNPALYYFVPGASASVTGGASDSKTIVWSISDEDLAATGEEATNLLFLSTQTVAGVAPFNPSVIVPYGDRMCYVTTTTDTNGNAIGCAYVSDVNNYQRVSPDRHLVTLPGQLNISTAFAMRQTLYLLGPNYVYGVSDTGTDPVEWPMPAMVDGRRGTIAPRGVTVSPTGQYAWIVNESGVHLFDGSAFARLPISFYNADWQTINWGAASVIQMVDDPDNKHMYVLAPLGTATTPSNILTFDYHDGLTTDKVAFSLDALSGYSLGSMALVTNELHGTTAANAKHAELWLGSSGTGAIMRQTSAADTYPYRDGAAAITSVWESSLLPEPQAHQMLRHHGVWVRATGAGTLHLSMKNEDATWTQALANITLSTAPGGQSLRQMYRIGERCSFRFTTDAVDEYMVIAELSHYHSPYSLQRT
jgi:hypothetical protein